MIHETSVVKKVYFPSTSMVDAKMKRLQRVTISITHLYRCRTVLIMETRWSRLQLGLLVRPTYLPCCIFQNYRSWLHEQGNFIILSKFWHFRLQRNFLLYVRQKWLDSKSKVSVSKPSLMYPVTLIIFTIDTTILISTCGHTYTANVLTIKTTGTGNCRVLQGKSALSMGKNCKNCEETP